MDPTSPVPVKNRGHHFNGQQYLKIGYDETHPSNYLLLGTSFSIDFWFKPEKVQTATLFTKGVIPTQIGVQRQSTFHLLSSYPGRLYFTGGFLAVNARQSSLWSVNTWSRATVTVEFEPYSGISNIKIYKNGNFNWYVQSDIFLDFAPSNLVLGADLKGNNGFTGYIYGLKIYTFTLPLQQTEVMTLDLCPFLTYLDAGCQTCPSPCLSGCVRTLDCNLCADRLCVTCRDFTDFPCLHCTPHASIPLLSSTCECDPGYYLDSPSFGSPICSPCHPRCALCTQPGESGCSLCIQGEYLLSTPPSQCICAASHYIDLGTGKCVPCPELCDVCDQEKCSICTENSQLFEGNCTCTSGYYQSLSTCIPCPPPCLLCTSTACLACPGDYLLISNRCQIPEFYCNLDVSNLTNRVIRLNFTAILAVPLEMKDINIDIRSENYDFALPWNFTLISPDSLRLVPVQLLDFPYDDSSSFHGTLIVTFLSPSSILNIAGGTLQTKLLETPIDWESNTTVPNPIKQQMQTTTQAVTGVILTLSIVNGGFAGFWGFINTFVLLVYLPIANFPIPEMLRNVLLGLNLLTILPNPFSYVSDPAVSESQTSPYMQDNGPNTSLFLPNISTYLLPISLGFLYSIWLLWSYQFIHYRELIRRLSLRVRWNGVIRLGIQSYMDVVFAGLLQGKSLQLLLVSAYGCVNVLTGVVSVVGMIAVTVWVPWFLRKHRGDVMKKEHGFKAMYGVLVEEFEVKKGWGALGTYVPFLFRRLLYALVLVFAFDYPYLQAALISLSAFLLFLHYVLFRPYISLFTQIAAGIQESVTFLTMLICSLYVLPLSSEVSNYLATLAVGLIVGGVILCGVVSVAETVTNGYKIWMEYREKRASRIRPRVEI